MADLLVDHIAAVARRWSDPEYDIRAAAVEETLTADNPFTEAAVTVAVNRQMKRLTKVSMDAWRARLREAIDRPGAAPMRTIGVLNPGNIPLVEVQDLIAVLLAGWSYVGTVSSRSPALFPAFLDELRREGPDVPARIRSFENTLTAADALIASGTDDTMSSVGERAAGAGLPKDRLWLRGHRIGVAVIDGRESEEEREALAEDVLLYDGAGCRSVAVVWAPAGVSPDPYLEAFAGFRAAFPASESVKGRLKMHQALLAAVDTPHAWADDFQFLVSRGEAEAQAPAHLRWSEYENVEEAAAWIASRERHVQEIYVPERLAKTFPKAARLGDAQDPPLDWCPDRLCHADFFARVDQKTAPGV